MSSIAEFATMASQLQNEETPTHPLEEGLPAGERLDSALVADRAERRQRQLFWEHRRALVIRAEGQVDKFAERLIHVAIIMGGVIALFEFLTPETRDRFAGPRMAASYIALGFGGLGLVIGPLMKALTKMLVRLIVRSARHEHIALDDPPASGAGV